MLTKQALYCLRHTTNPQQGSHWVFHFQNFAFIFFRIAMSLWNLLIYFALSSLFHLAVYFYYHVIHSDIVLFNFIEHSYNHSFEFFFLISSFLYH
jgi:hypothetical protein